jgi:hypothetical protein
MLERLRERQGLQRQMSSCTAVIFLDVAAELFHRVQGRSTLHETEAALVEAKGIQWFSMPPRAPLIGRGQVLQRPLAEIEGANATDIRETLHIRSFDRGLSPSGRYTNYVAAFTLGLEHKRCFSSSVPASFAELPVVGGWWLRLNQTLRGHLFLVPIIGRKY